MPAIYSHSHVVTADEIDDLGHVNNLHYLKWALQAAVAHSSAQGWPPERYREMRTAWVVHSHWIEYRLPAFVGEEVIVQTWVSEFGKATSLRKYNISRPTDGTVLVVAKTQWAFLGRDGYVPRRIPPELRDAFDLVAPEAEP